MGATLASPIFFLIILPCLLTLVTLYGEFPKLKTAFKRLKWLLLSIFILNLWFNSPEFTWLPTFNQINTALFHLLPLVTIVLGVHLLLIMIPTTTLISVIQWWLRPLVIFSIPIDRFSLRIVLILELIETMQHAYTTYPKDKKLSLLQNITKRIAYLFIFTYQQAQNTPLKILVVKKLDSPPQWQWSFPILFCILIGLMSF